MSFLDKLLGDSKQISGMGNTALVDLRLKHEMEKYEDHIREAERIGDHQTAHQIMQQAAHVRDNIMNQAQYAHQAMNANGSFGMAQAKLEGMAVDTGAYGMSLAQNVAAAQQAQNAAMAQNVYAGNMQNMAMKPIEEKEEVLMFQGREMPSDWRGASYQGFNRAIVQASHQWKVTYISKWASDSILIWFSMDKYSGEQVDELARTYLEVINTRRLG